MTHTEALLMEFDQETAHTRKSLQRIPEDRFDFKPHEKSMPLGRLASHLAEIPTWAVNSIKLDRLDLSPPEGEPFQPCVYNTRDEVLAAFDKNAADARAALAGTNDDHIAKPWSLLLKGKTLFTMPRAVVLRSFVMNHTIHHRAQLGVYLRLNSVPVPAIYGPSADETGM